MNIALVSARAARGLDEDEAPLLAALQAAGCRASRAEWDDPATEWRAFDVALLRSAWDYAERIGEFLRWAQQTAASTTLLNPLPVVRWNTDKHYLADLSRAGAATVPSRFVEPGESAAAALRTFLEAHPQPELVVKPAVGAGARDTQRHARSELGAARAHVERLLQAGRSVLLQPYLGRIDTDGETALMFFGGHFSHAVRKGALLRPGGAATSALFAAESIAAREPGTDELHLAERVLAAIPHGIPLYARIDLIRDDTGAPRLLELELTEPSLFFAHAPGSAERFAGEILRRA